MRIREWREPYNGGEYHLEVVFTDSDIGTAPLSGLERWVMNSERSTDTPIADALLDAQQIAFRIEQAASSKRETA